MYVGVLMVAAVAGLAGFLISLRTGRWAAGLGCLLVMSAALKGVSGSHAYLSHWDERYHALVAKRVMGHPLEPTLYEPGVVEVNPSDWARTDVWLHKPPLTLWVLAASMWAAGVNVFALRLPSLVLSTAAIGLTYWIGKQLYGPRVGLMAAWFHAVTGVLVAQAAGRFSTDHVDTLFFFLMELGVALGLWHSRKPTWGRALAVGVVLGLALLTKWYPALLMVAVWGLWLKREQWKRALPQMAAAVAVGGAMFWWWRAWTHSQWPVVARWEETYNSRHFLEVLEGHKGPWYAHLANIGNFFSPVAYVPLVAFAIALFRKDRPAGSWALAAWFLLPYGLYTVAATKMGGYVLPAAPMIFLVSAVFWWWLYERPAAGAWRVWKGVALVLLMAAPVIPLVHRVMPEKERPERDRYTAEIAKLPERLGPGRAMLFNARAYIEIMFFTPYVALDRMPTAADVKRAREGGYRVVLVDDGTGVAGAAGVDEVVKMPPAPGE